MRGHSILASAILVVSLGAFSAVAQQTPEVKPYKLTWQGADYELGSGTSPDDYLGRCVEGGWGKAPTPTLQRAFCLKLMLVWGENLFSHFGKPFGPADPVGSALGRDFLKKAFGLLADDLEAQTGRPLALALRIHYELQMRVEWFPIKDYRDELVHAAVRYYLAVWKSVPAAPATFQEFLEKYEAGEQLKELLFQFSLSTPSTVAMLLDFYQSAFLLHERPAPESAVQGDRASLNAVLGAPGLIPQIGYIRISRNEGLVPVDKLPLDDLDRAATVLQMAKQQKMLSEDEAQARLHQIEKQKAAFQVERDKWWLDLMQKRGDRDGVAAYRSMLRELYFQAGDTPGAIREQEQLCALLGAMGDRGRAASQAVVLATLRYTVKQWQGVLDALANANQDLWDTAQVEDLRKALALEVTAQNELHAPDRTQDWVTRYQALLDDVGTSPDMANEGNDSTEQKVANYQKWLSEPGHLEPMRMAVRSHLADSLQSLHQYAESERLAGEVIDELEKQGIKNKELESLGVLLEIESHGGDIGRFYNTLDRYEKVGRDLHGDEDWVQTSDGLDTARVLLGLGDVHRAESVLSREMDQEKFEALRSPGFSRQGKQDVVADQDLLLEARIDLELGRNDEAEAIVHSLSQAGRWKSQELIVDLAELDAALGDDENTIYKCDLLSEQIKTPLDDLYLWVRINLAKSRAQLALGRDPGEIVHQFADLAPQFTQYKDLDAGQAVDMDIFLADYFAWKKDDTNAVTWLNKGLALADELGSIDPRIEIHRKLGEAARRGGDRDTAIKEFRRSVSLVNSISTMIPSDIGKVGYRGDRNKATALLVMALYEEYQRTADPRPLAEMWRAVENGKSRALSERVLAGSGSDLDKLTLDEIRAALPPSGELLEYYIPEGAGDVVFRFIANRQGANVEVLPIKASQMTAIVTALKAEVDASADSYDETAFRKHCSELGAVLLPRDWEVFTAADTRHLYVVPAGILYLFPFALLGDARGKFLDENEHVQVTYLPNATMILRAAPRFADAARSLAFVNPAYDPEHTGFLESDPTLEPAFESALRSWSKATVYWERTFTARDLLAEAEKADNVYIYSHGSFIPEDPLSSYIRLADDAGNSTVLSAADILKATLGHGLWVLAACSTGSGRVRSGDEVLGLPRALLQAGASMVVVPLWEVHVSSSWRLMNLFYSNLATGLPVSQALHAAAAQIRSEHAAPYDWAPFILVGQHGYRN